MRAPAIRQFIGPLVAVLSRDGEMRSGNLRRGYGPVQIKISTRHGHLSEASQEKIRDKLERLTRYFERLSSIEVTVDLQVADLPEVHARISAEHKHDFVAQEGGQELFKSVDAIVQKLEQQLRKYKERIQGHHRGDIMQAEP